MIRVCKAFMPILKEQAFAGTYKECRVLNVTSVAGLITGGFGLSAYHSTKHGAQAFTECWRAEMARMNVTVCSVNPSFHQTPMTEGKNSNPMTDLYMKNTTEQQRKEYGDGALCVF